MVWVTIFVTSRKWFNRLDFDAVRKEAIKCLIYVRCR